MNGEEQREGEVPSQECHKTDERLLADFADLPQNALQMQRTEVR